MSCVRDILPFVNFQAGAIPYERIANLEVSMKHFMNALLETEPSATRAVFVEIPDVSMNDIGGLAEIKQKLIDTVIWPLKNPEIFERYKIQPMKGIIMYGAPGTGKTMLAKAIAHESGVNFINVQSANLMSRYLGDSERALKEIFRTAKQAAPSIICFDGIDSLFPDRNAGQNSQFGMTLNRLTGQFLSEMQGIEELTGVTVIATTNRPKQLDKALFAPGVFDVKIKMVLPDVDEREEIFRLSLRDKPLGDDVNLQGLAILTDDMSGGDIAFICRSAALEAVRENPEDFRIMRRHFMPALESLMKKDKEAKPENMIELIADKEYARLDQFLAEKLDVSRSKLQNLLKIGCIRGKGQLKQAMKVNAGDVFYAEIPPSENLDALVGEDVDFDVIYEDKDLIVVNKPAGIVVHPAPGNWHGTLIQGLVLRYPEIREMTAFLRPGIVSRLDQGTSGLMVVARNEESLRLLSEMFSTRQVDKKYLALVHGCPPRQEGLLSGPIDEDPNNPLKRAVVEGGKEAFTRYRVIWTHGTFSLVECKILTGRTHQIRVHMSALGCPLFGDSLYGAKEQFLSRVFLHSWKLAFTHPVTGEELSFRQTIPEEFKNLIESLRGEI